MAYNLKPKTKKKRGKQGFFRALLFISKDD